MTDLLRVIGLSKAYPLRRGFFRRQVGSVTAVDGVDFCVSSGRTLAIVGESGCGKTTLGRLLLRLVEPDSGEVYFDGVDVLALARRELRTTRCRMQMVFQDPFSSLNPRLTVNETLSGPMRLHGINNPQQRVADLLTRVGLSPGHADRFPHEFSGGQRQRIGIARALALGPELLIADEPVSALDVSVRAQILNLLAELRSDLNLTLLIISHDLSVVHHISDEVAVMYLGRIVEYAGRDDLFGGPRHPYTQALLSAVPRVKGRGRRIILPGEAASQIEGHAGCAFHPRCPLAFERCKHEVPNEHRVGPSHRVACHLYETSAEPVPIV